MRITKFPNNRGFNLIELMVVVAIIGILAAIAVPNFNRFQRKSRQSEARSMLAAYHVAIKSNSAEQGCFRGNFVTIGFLPEGELTYRLTTSDNASCTLPSATAQVLDIACITTSDPCDGITTNYIKVWTERPVSARDSSTVESVTNNSYIASVAGWLGADNLQNDEWTINENKTLLNVSSGL